MNTDLIPSKITASLRRPVEPESPEFRALIDKLYAEERERFGPMLDAMLMEAQTLRKAEGHKARERTLSSEDTDRARQHRSIATE
jgi:hypothetical protein